MSVSTFRPRVEQLDDRCLPSTFTVTNLLDTGPDSLRAAVAAANANPGADTIDFATAGTIALTSGQLNITDSLTISGPGAGALTVSGESVSRVFGITGDPTVLIADLTVANGYGSPGGGISVAGGTVTLDHVTVTGNIAEGQDNSYFSSGLAAGGGLYVGGGTLTLEQCTVSGNEALGGPGVVDYYVDDYHTYSSGYTGGQARGGGLFVAAGVVVYVNQSTISLNWASGGAGGDAWGADILSPGNGGESAGGGIRVEGDATLEIRQSTVFGNRAVGGRSGWDDPDFAGVSTGGGLCMANGHPLAFLDTFTVSNTINNFADIDPNIFGPYSLDGMPRLSIGNSTVLEGNDGTTALVFTVTLSGSTGQAVSVDYATADGTATSAGSDYTAASGTLTIPAGQTTGTITVWVNGDRLAEPNKTFFVNLSNATNATNATVANGQAAGTIVDDEPRVSISNVSKAEGKNRATTLFTFTVTLSAAYDQPVTMSFATANGTATTGGGDYVAKSGTLTFAPGDTTKTITIEVKGDKQKEATEYFYLDLFDNSDNSLFTKSRGTGTILNDD